MSDATVSSDAAARRSPLLSRRIGLLLAVVAAIEYAAPFGLNGSLLRTGFGRDELILEAARAFEQSVELRRPCPAVNILPATVLLDYPAAAVDELLRRTEQ